MRDGRECESKRGERRIERKKRGRESARVKWREGERERREERVNRERQGKVREIEKRGREQEE
jgi:hypothetical protein